MARIPWDKVSGTVRSSLESELGASVISAENQPGGFSPGLAARCELDDGRRVFIKAVSHDQNEHAPNMHRRERDTAAGFPMDFPSPQLLHSYDDGLWVALVFRDVEGQPPQSPWTLDQLDLTLNALEGLTVHTDPSPVADLPVYTDILREDFTGWARFSEHGIGDGTHPIGNLEPWIVANIDTLATTESTWAAGCSGSSLVHGDLRSDNLVIDGDGHVWFVDWAHAARGQPWTDLAGMIPSMVMEGAPPAEEIWQRSAWATSVEDDALTAFVVALAGYFTWGARQPPPKGLPTLRSFMEAQGTQARRWVGLRMGLT